MPGGTYYARAYATNSVGTAYGIQTTIMTTSIVPILSTTELIGISSTSATVSGNITSDGGAAVIARGVCWSRNTMPVVGTDSTTNNGFGTGIFTSSVTDLSPGKTYYIRAYATNSIGTAYSNQLTVSTSAILPALTTSEVFDITPTTASSGGNITNDGGSTITARGVCWSTSQNPTKANSITTNGTGTGTYTCSMNDLIPGETYYVRAYATNSIGTSYGNQVTFNASITTPTISTTEITAITSTTATSGGNITSDGGAGVTARGVCWSTSPNPTTANSKTTNGMGTGSFVSSITALTPGTTYYLRAYATNSVGTSYGTQITFNTSANVPTVTTTAITDITPETATSGGDVTNDGGSTVSARGVCWSTTPTPTIANSKTTDGTGTGSFTSSLLELEQNTTYYVRAYATNSLGTGYGSIVTFTSSVRSPQSEFKPMGLIPMTLSQIESIPAIEDVNPLSHSKFMGSGILPSKVTLDISGPVILEVPTPGSQKLGSCVGWAVGYGMMSYLFKTVEGYEDYNGNDRKFSPYYIYSQREDRGDNGWNIKSACDLVMNQGCCKLSDMPTMDLTTWPSVTQKNLAANYKLSSYYRIKIFEINKIKTYLAQGFPAVISVAVDKAFETFIGYGQNQFETQPDGRLVWKEYKGKSTGKHAMLIYGYDDNISAFKVLNSWNYEGVTWANNGSFWIDYDFIKEAVLHKWGSIYYEIIIGFVERPVLSTRAVSEITNNSAKCGGIISNDWGKTVTVNGVCWSTNHDPTISDNRTYDVTGSDSFLSTISGLLSGSTYYVKAYAINSEGVAYGKEKQFTTTSTQSPTVTTSPVTTYNSTSATVGGNVTGDGGSTVTQRGVYWGNSANPETTGTKLQIGSGTGSFSTTLSGLSPNTTYYIRAYATSSQGTAYGSQVTFTTGVLPIAAFIGTPTTIIAGQSVQFTDQSTNTPTSWSWNFGDGGTSTYRNPSHTYASAGVYTVILTATNSFGTNSLTRTNYITVNPSGSSPVAAFSANPTTIKEGESVQFTDQSTNIPTSWSWDFGDGGTSTSRNPSHIYASAGTYTVSLTATNITGSNTLTKTNYIVVSPAGYSPVAAFSANPTTINEGQSVQFTDQSTNNPTSWSWDFGDGGTSNAQNPSHTYSSAGTYSVLLRVTNNYGSNTLTKTTYITVNAVIGDIIFNPNLTYGSVTDIDGNVYKTIQIGSQVWMAENLKTTKYRNGNLIGTTTPATLSIVTETSPKYQWAYDGNESNVETYGRLYTWHAATDSRNICPSGWHLPTSSEWITLIDNIGGRVDIGENQIISTNVGKIKEIGTTHWNTANVQTTNSSGFTALPCGNRDFNGPFEMIGEYAFWWCSNESNPTTTWAVMMEDNINVYILHPKEVGYSVRCIRD